MTAFTDLFNSGGGAIPIWVSGSVVPQWAVRTSPLDGEIYRKINASGASATDPANDVTNYVAVSFVRSTTLPLRQQAWATQAFAGAANYAFGIVKTTPGAIANGVRTSILSLTGRGGIGFLGLQASAAGSTFRFEVICDGRTIYDTTIASAANSTITYLGNTFPGTPPGAGGSNNDGYGSPDNNGPRFRRTLQVFLTPTVATWPAGGALAASYWSEA